MSNTDIQHYLYSKRYLTREERKQRSRNLLKGRMLEFIAKRKKIINKYKILDAYSLDRKKWIDKYNVFIDDVIKRDENLYTGIKLNDVSFFEVVELDDFKKFRNTLLTKFGNNTGFLGLDRKEDLEKELSDLENKFEKISWGRLFSINYKKERTSSNDLIDYIDCNYIKTNESYFIIRFDISLSEKADCEIDKIIQQKDIGLSYPNYYSFYRIFQKKRFYISTSYMQSLKAFNISNFISDLSNQVKENVTQFFNGYFHASKIFKTLPSIQLYNVDDISKFKEDKELVSIYRSGFGKYFSIDDEQIEVHFSDRCNDSEELVHVFKQTGHGNREKNRSDLSDYDRLESHDIISSLSFPCVFSAILREQNYKLSNLKRLIYDQIRISGNKYILKHFFLLGTNNKYLQLKHKSVQVLLTMKRFEDEFTDRSIHLYTRDFPLESFHAKNQRGNEAKNLLEYYIKAFRYQIDGLDKKTKSINEVFKSLEEFNSYKTNFILQLFSILIGILAFIFAFDKTKDFVLSIIKWIFE
jgi:hypothetical protein